MNPYEAALTISVAINERLGLPERMRTSLLWITPNQIDLDLRLKRKLAESEAAQKNNV